MEKNIREYSPQNNKNQKSIARDMLTIMFAGIVGFGFIYASKVVFKEDNLKKTEVSNEKTQELEEKITELEKKITESQENYDAEKEKLMEKIKEQQLIIEEKKSLDENSRPEVFLDKANSEATKALSLDSKIGALEKSVEMFLEDTGEWDKGNDILLNLSEVYKEKITNQQNKVIQDNMLKMIKSGFNFIKENINKKDYLDKNKKIIDTVEKVMKENQKAFSDKDRKDLEAIKLIMAM